MVSAYEQAARQIVNNERPATPEQRGKAEQFLQNLQDYNQELATDEKILDAKGKLINPATATETQRGNLERMLNGNTNSRMKNRQRVEEAADRMQLVMRDAMTQLQRGVDTNFKDKR